LNVFDIVEKTILCAYLAVERKRRSCMSKSGCVLHNNIYHGHGCYGRRAAGCAGRRAVT
jgi:hypothetical protein